MGIYLDKLRSTLSQVQSRQITNLLLKKKDSGEIKSIEEFKKNLAALTDRLLADAITPTLQAFLDNYGNIISSETHNYMLERIRDDLEAIFSEANTLSEVMDAHVNIVNNVILRRLRQGVAELESKISLLEFLNQDSNGFSNAQFNTFKASQNLSFSRGNDANSNILFVDPRSKDTIDSDAFLDPIGERLTLGPSNQLYAVIKHVEQIFDNEATQSAELVSFPTNVISNIIDNTLGTYWIYSVLQPAPNVNGILVKLKFDLSNYTDINSIEIESAAALPMELVRIDYRNGSNTITSINMNDIPLIHSKKIHIDTITTNEIILVVRQQNAVILQYENKVLTENFTDGLFDVDKSVDLTSVETEIRQVISSSKILSDILNLQPDATTGEIKKYYDYAVGFDNIRFALSEYSERSIFVSEPIELTKLNQIGLKRRGTRPFDNIFNVEWLSYADETSSLGLGSVEYWAVLQNFTPDDDIFSINTVPILPIGLDIIRHERLLLTHKVDSSLVNNAGYTIFYTLNDTPALQFTVFRNGTPLTYGLDWDIVPAPFTNNVVPPNGSPNRVGIKINAPSYTDFYTITYIPLLGNTRLEPQHVFSNPVAELGDTGVFSYIVDLVGDGSITLGQDNILYANLSSNISYTKVYLVILLRRNSPNTHVSPLVDEYTFLTSETNKEKFSG